MTKLVSIFLIMMFPLQVMANELPQITPLEKNQKAPYSGILYNPAAVAESIAQREALIQQHQLNLNILEESLKAQCDLSLQNLQSDLSACNDRYDQMVLIKDTQIKNLQDLALERPNDHSIWWLAGGIVLGVVATVGITYAVNK
jgi:hypothetical protein